MKGNLLKVHLLFFFHFMILSNIHAQDMHFIYIQNSDEAPFYVKMDNQILCSAPSGYIILPKLTADSHQMTIGFPESDIPDFIVTLKLNGVDAGYLLKTDIDQSRYMVNMQTLKPVAIEERLPKESAGQFIENNDEFARVLSEVVGDPSIRLTSVLINTAVAQVKTEDIKQGNNTPAIKTETVNQPGDNIIADKVTISKTGQSNSSGGLQRTSLNNGSAGTNTDLLTAPQEKLMLTDKNDMPLETPANNAKTTDGVNTGSGFVNMEMQNSGLRKDLVQVKKMN